MTGFQYQGHNTTHVTEQTVTGFDGDITFKVGDKYSEHNHDDYVYQIIDLIVTFIPGLDIGVIVVWVSQDATGDYHIGSDNGRVLADMIQDGLYKVAQ